MKDERGGGSCHPIVLDAPAVLMDQMRFTGGIHWRWCERLEQFTAPEYVERYRSTAASHVLLSHEVYE